MGTPIGGEDQRGKGVLSEAELLLKADVRVGCRTIQSIRLGAKAIGLPSVFKILSEV